MPKPAQIGGPAFSLGWEMAQGVLQKEKFSIMSDSECEALYEAPLNEKVICATGAENCVVRGHFLKCQTGS